MPDETKGPQGNAEDYTKFIEDFKLIEALLLPMNYEVIKAFNGPEALSMVNKTELDLVLLDIMMPGMTGYEVCQRLKESEDTRFIPVGLVTALDDIDAKVKGFLEIVDGSRDAQWTDLRNLFRRPLHVPKATHQEDDFLPPSED